MSPEEKDAILAISCKPPSVKTAREMRLEKALKNTVEYIRGLREYADDRCLLDFDGAAHELIQEIKEALNG